MQFCYCGERATTVILGSPHCADCAGDFYTGKSKEQIKKQEQQVDEGWEPGDVPD